MGKFFENEKDLYDRYENGVRSGGIEKDYETWKEDKHHTTTADYTWNDGPPENADYETRSAYYQNPDNFERDDEDDEDEM